MKQEMFQKIGEQSCHGNGLTSEVKHDASGRSYFEIYVQKLFVHAASSDYSLDGAVETPIDIGDLSYSMILACLSNGEKHEIRDFKEISERPELAIVKPCHDVGSVQYFLNMPDYANNLKMILAGYYNLTLAAIKEIMTRYEGDEGWI